MNSFQIKADLPVECSDHGVFAHVDHMEGKDLIKLKKDKSGQHHFIPLSWVSKVDDKVHIDRPGEQAMKEWTTTAKLPDTKQFDRKSVDKNSQPSAKSQERASNEGMRNASAKTAPSSSEQHR